MDGKGQGGSWPAYRAYVVYLGMMGVEQGPLGGALVGKAAGRQRRQAGQVERSSWAVLGCGARVV